MNKKEIIDKINISKLVYAKNIDENFNIKELRYFIEILKKFKSWDKNNDCFGDHNFNDLLFSTIKYYDTFLLRYRFNIIGGIFIGTPKEDKTIIEIANIIKKKYRGLGIGSQLFKRTLKTCFEDYDCSKIYLTVNVDNIASRKMLEKNGVEFTGNIIKDNSNRFGIPVDQAVYEYDKDNFSTNSNDFINIKKLTR